MIEKLCDCGCGQVTPIAKMTNRKRGHIRGVQTCFISGHNQLKTKKRAGFPPGVLVDLEDDYLRLAYNWRLGTGGYVQANFKLNRRRHVVMLHRAITNCPSDKMVDHLNRDKLDNRRTNLRIVTALQNQHNRKASRNSESGHLNACRRGNKWYAQIAIDGRRIYGGSFATPQEASAAAARIRAEHGLAPPIVHDAPKPRGQGQDRRAAARASARTRAAVPV